MSLCPVARTTGWCWKCYDGVRHKAYHRGHAYYRTQPRLGKGEAMALLRRTGSIGSGPAVPAGDAEVSKLVPDLVEFLTGGTWPDGTPRRTGTVMVLSEDGVFKAWVHDRDGACSAWVSAGALMDLLDAVEKLLGDPVANWRRDGFKGKR